MPRGGRRPGAGAPKGNFNAVKGGAYSRRMRIAMAVLFTVPEYRLMLKFLHTAGEEAHRDFRDLMVATTRILYDRPVSDEIRSVIDKAASNYVLRVGPVEARRAIREHLRRAGAGELTPPTKKLSRRDLSTDNPIFQEFARLLTGIDLGADNQPSDGGPRR